MISAMSKRVRQQRGATAADKRQRTYSDGSGLMTDKHKGILTRNYETLVSNLTPDRILNRLVAEEIITIREQEELLEEVILINRTGALLRLLLKREDRAFYVLIEACMENVMPHLAMLLRDADGQELDDADEQEDAIIVSYEETKFEVDKEKNGTVRASSIESMLPPGLFAKGLESAGGLTIKPTRGKFVPPNNRWDSKVYIVLAGPKEEDQDSDIVFVSYNGKNYGTELEMDGTVLVCNIEQIIDSGFKIRSLQYNYDSAKKASFLYPTGGKFSPPDGNWRNIVYTVLLDAILVEYKGVTHTVRLEEDGTVLLPTVRQMVLPDQPNIKGLKYIHPVTGWPRIVRLTDDRLDPPTNGWGSLVYSLLIDTIRVSHNGTTYEVDLEEDGVVPRSSIQHKLHGCSATVKGLKYDSHSNGSHRLVRLSEGTFYPPKCGWGTVVYSVLTGSTDKYDKEKSDHGMTNEHYGILERHRMTLMGAMDVLVMDHLRTEGILSLTEHEKIKEEKGKTNQIGSLLDLLLRTKDDDAFKSLVICLKRTNQRRLAQMLETNATI